jgi:hypothetical protein
MDRADEVPLLTKLKTCEMLTQIIHRMLIWLAYLALAIVGIIVIYYVYTFIFLTKDWILDIWDTIYGYLLDFYDTLHEVYEFVLEIPSIVGEFIEDIGSKIVGEIEDFLPF